jgi:hypothetical protein
MAIEAFQLKQLLMETLLKKYRLIFTGSLFVLLLVLSCAKKVIIQKTGTFDFDKINSYAWVAAVKDSSKSAAQKLLKSNVRKSFERNLSLLGWKKVSRHPSVLLVYDIDFENASSSDNDPLFSQPTTRWYYSESSKGYVPIFYPARGMGFYNKGVTESSGTVILSILNVRTKKIIWQGRTATALDGRQLTDKEIETNVKAIVKEMIN